MPIKYQALGGGGGTDLLLKIAPNISVTLSKGAYAKTIIAGKNGQALFKNLSNGTYTATAQGSDGERYQKEFLIDDVQEDFIVVSKIGDLPLKAKIKLSSGKKFILQAKNAYSHPDNSATLVGEHIIGTASFQISNWSGEDYLDNKALIAIFNDNYNALTHYERNNILKFKAEYDGYSDSVVTRYFWFISPFELGLDEYGNPTNPESSDGKKSLGFTDDKSRIKKLENGEVGTYWTRYISNYNSFSSVYIDKEGKQKETDWFNDPSQIATEGVVINCDVSQNAKVYLDTDGYWVIAE